MIWIVGILGIAAGMSWLSEAIKVVGHTPIGQQLGNVLEQYRDDIVKSLTDDFTAGVIKKMRAAPELAGVTDAQIQRAAHIATAMAQRAISAEIKRLAERGIRL